MTKTKTKAKAKAKTKDPLILNSVESKAYNQFVQECVMFCSSAEDLLLIKPKVLNEALNIVSDAKAAKVLMRKLTQAVSAYVKLTDLMKDRFTE